MVLVATLAKQQTLMKAKSEQRAGHMCNDLTSRHVYVRASIGIAIRHQPIAAV